MSDSTEPTDFDPLLDYLKRSRGFDFAAYKRPSLMRRIQKRMQRDTVVPAVVGGAAAAHAVRVWSAGCASGEEAHSIAMLLAEALGRDAFRERVKIYATARRRARAARGPRRHLHRASGAVGAGECSTATSSARTTGSCSTRISAAR
jgi:hypothetical protein